MGVDRWIDADRSTESTAQELPRAHGAAAAVAAGQASGWVAYGNGWTPRPGTDQRHDVAVPGWTGLSETKSSRAPTKPPFRSLPRQAVTSRPRLKCARAAGAIGRQGRARALPIRTGRLPQIRSRHVRWSADRASPPRPHPSRSRA
jgi:hypothetical protein